MKNQHETSLRIRLAGMAILGLFIALAAAAYFSGQQVKRSSELIATDAVPGTIAAHNMRMAMSRSIGWVMVAASAQTTQSRDASLKIVHDADAAYTNFVNQYGATIKINPAEDRVLLERVTSLYTEYYKQRMTYEALILAGDREKSAAFLETNLVPVYVAAIHSAEELLKYNNANSITYANYIRNSVHHLYWAVAVVMALALICAAVLVVNFAIRRQEIIELRASEARFRMLIENAPTAISISREGKTLYVNPKWFALYGSNNSEDPIGHSIVKQLAPECREMVADYARRRALGEPMPSEYEVVGLRGDGSQFPIHIAVASVELSDGKASLAFLTDMTERKRAEESLKLFRMLIDHANDSIEVVDPMTGRFLDVNEKAGKLHGYTREEYLALTIPEIDPAFAAAGDKAWQAHLENLKRFGFLVFETQHRRKDGFVFPVEINASYVRLERDYILAVVRDITEQKRAQEEMRATNKRYHRQEEALMRLTQSVALRKSLIPEIKREVVQIAAETLEVERVSIWRYERDHEGIVCQELFERSNQSHSSGTVLHAKDFPAYFRALADGNVIAAPDAHRDPRTAEFSETYLRPLVISSMLDTPIHVIGSMTGVVCCEHVGPPRQWTTDEQTFAIAVANLVSLLLAEEERQQIEEQFRQSQKMEAVGQLASGVAHDFNNILGIILMQADLLKSEGNLSPAQMEFASEIGEATQRAAALTRQLLLFSRKEKMQTRELDLDKSINEMTKMLRRTLGANVELRFKFSMQSLFVHADPGMMDQVLMNLAVNARDAMPQGGKLIVETSAVELDELSLATFPLSRPGAFVCLSVSDTGTGIPPEILPKIFEPFFTTKDVGKGTGLGLATVFGIVQQHQGWVSVYSEVGHGTTFRIYLPRLAKNSDQKFVAPLIEATSGGDETILVVEDEPKLRASVINILTRLGYNVIEASDGASALEAWKKHRAQVLLAKKVWNQHRDDIQLLLTDMVMPGGMTGKDLGEQLLKENPGLKVLYVSGYSPEIASKDFPLVEGVNFLTKPFPAVKLAQIIRKLLNG